MNFHDRTEEERGGEQSKSRASCVWGWATVATVAPRRTGNAAPKGNVKKPNEAKNTQRSGNGITYSKALIEWNNGGGDVPSNQIQRERKKVAEKKVRKIREM